jgi:diguanylate cyclase (GGDEF)-like protein
MTPTVDPAELNRLLARDYFGRTRLSSLSALPPLGVMVYSPFSAGRWVQGCLWLAAMSLFLALRSAHGKSAVSGAIERRGVEALLRRETVLSVLIGLGWGAALFLFDEGRLTPLFYLRLMIVAVGVTFVLSSSTAFLRMPLIAVASVGSGVMAYLVSHPYIEPHGPLIAATLVEAAVIAGLAFSINRRERIAASDHLSVIALSRMLEKSSRTDELTGIANRRGILEALSAELAVTGRHTLPLAVLMADIDHFKAINDTHGHAAGDEALRTVSRALGGALREGDSVGRLGGEEFLVLLPMLEGAAAIGAAERLRREIEQSHTVFEGRDIPLSISIGIGCRRQGDSVDSLLARADAALYAAKGAGRNRVAMELPG